MGEIHGTLHEIINFWWKLLETSIFHPKFLGKSEVFLGISQLWSIPGRFGAGLPGAQGGFASGFASACTGAPPAAPKAVPVQRAAAKAKEHGWQLKFMVIICYYNITLRYHIKKKTYL